MASETVRGSIVGLFRAVLISVSVLKVVGSPVTDLYLEQRERFIKAEQELRIGGTGSRLSEQEKLVDRVLLQEKRSVINATIRTSKEYPGVRNFLNRDAAARTARNSSAYKIIKNMPKGGVLHVHDEAITSIDWLVKNVTYRDHCYVCFTNSSQSGLVFKKFHFYSSPPASDDDCTWSLVRDLRNAHLNDDDLDRRLHASLTLVTDDPDTAYPDVNAVWDKFMDYFGKTEGLMLYAPVFEDYLYEGLKQFREDNVQYLEIRGLLPPVYELNGTTHDKRWVLDVYKRVNARFVSDYPDFTGFKFIMTSLRFKDQTAMLEDIKEATSLHVQDPDFMVGFDMVGQEDRLHPLKYYLSELQYPEGRQPHVDLLYFFHTGETKWQETDVDYNLVDAVLLNTKRIGHGFALNKHPLVMQRVKDRNICVEVNPISSQVLRLVDDLRNHPAAALIADSFSIVIGSDDPPSWEATPLTDDFYVTFMALTGQEAGLATLKQLAKNSILCSAMNDKEKAAALTAWEQKWGAFIKATVRDMGLTSAPPTGQKI